MLSNALIMIFYPPKALQQAITGKEKQVPHQHVQFGFDRLWLKG
jgi:hypothetical protein